MNLTKPFIKQKKKVLFLFKLKKKETMPKILVFLGNFVYKKIIKFLNLVLKNKFRYQNDF